MTHNAKRDQRTLKFIAQSDRLNKVAVAHTGNINESRLLVHGVMARAFAVDAPCNTDLDLALSRSVARWLEDRQVVA